MMQDRWTEARVASNAYRRIAFASRLTWWQVAEMVDAGLGKEPGLHWLHWLDAMPEIAVRVLKGSR